MTTADSNFAGSLVYLYDKVLGPFMFEPFAREVAGRLNGFTGEVLEVAAGTGIFTRALDDVLALGSLITATDLNRPMLELASRARTSPRVTWRQADALRLPFAGETFDAVACQFGVMFYPDQGLGHREARRVLRSGGRYVLSVWDDLVSNPVADIVHQTVAAYFPHDPPEFFARTPHGHHDNFRLRESLAAAGFTAVTIETVRLPAGRLAADEVALGFCQGTPLRHEIEQRSAADLAGVTQAVATALLDAFGEGAIETMIQAHIAVAVP